MTMLGRRILTCGGLLALGGCGFRPLYQAAGGNREAEAGLSRIYVAILPERSGQLLRQALQERLDGSGSGVAKDFELTASLQIAGEGIAVQRDNSSSRIRLTASAPWVLRSLAPGRPVVTSGVSRVLDGYNVLDQQYFAADLENDAAIRRVASTLAEQITLALAGYFKRATPG